MNSNNDLNVYNIPQLDQYSITKTFNRIQNFNRISQEETLKNRQTFIVCQQISKSQERKQIQASLV